MVGELECAGRRDRLLMPSDSRLDVSNWPLAVDDSAHSYYWCGRIMYILVAT